MLSINQNFKFEHESSDLSSQIDRLNQALEVVMKEIEAASCSRNASRLSLANSEYAVEEESSETSDHILNYDKTIESLLQTIDRQQMIIEDLFSEEKRRNSTPVVKERCGHDINRIRKEVWLQVTMHKNEQTEKERKKFEEKLEMLDFLQTDYLEKKKDLINGIEKLKQKEKLLQEKEKILVLKEKDLRYQSLLIDKVQSELDKKTEVELSHSRRSSFSHLPVLSKTDQLKALQAEIKDLEEQKRGSSNLQVDIQIEHLKGKLANLRGEIAISESSKTSKLMSSMMVSLKQEAIRDDKLKRIELLKAVDKNILKTNDFEKKIDKNAAFDAPVPKGFKEPSDRGLKDFISQADVIKIPGAKELIENVNLTLSKLNKERVVFDKEREEFNREKVDWYRNKRK